MDVERLIEYVKNHVFLYDLCHRDYKNPSLKAKTWESIGRELNESGDTCRLKWKTVRDGYIKYKKQLKSGKPNAREIDYIWRTKLSFLDNYNATRTSFYITDLNKTTNSIPSVSTQVECSKPQNESTSFSPPPLVPFGSLTNVSKCGSTSCQANKDFRREICDQDSFRSFRESSKDIDATDHLFLSYSGTFKKFSLRQQALMKIELAKLFANAELEQLQNTEDSEIRVQDNYSPLVIKSEYAELELEQLQNSEDSEIGVHDNYLPLVIKSEYAEVQNGESDVPEHEIEEKPAKRPRRAPPRQ